MPSPRHGNRQFPRFLAILGSHVIPRQSVRLSVDTPAERRAYLARIQHEHPRIVDGIAAADAVEARRAMREHLTRSLERYRNLAEERSMADAKDAPHRLHRRVRRHRHHDPAAAAPSSIPGWC